MDVAEIEIGVSYRGAPDYSRGFGSHRTPIGLTSGLLMFRVDPGPTPPDCYVSHGAMSIEEFAAWAESRAVVDEPDEAPSPR